jgi:hypothetical protein
MPCGLVLALFVGRPAVPHASRRLTANSPPTDTAPFGSAATEFKYVLHPFAAAK